MSRPRLTDYLAFWWVVIPPSMLGIAVGIIWLCTKLLRWWIL